MPQSLAKWLEYIETLHPEEIELGLERVRKVYNYLPGIPGACRVITVAGTNGKGSTIAFMESILLAAGYNVGTYTSPHLIDFSERIKTGNKQADDAELILAFSAVEHARKNEKLTYFEFTTLAAFYIFANSQPALDIIIVEVGLGGRLDATNILDPDIAIITSIDLDHQAWLGSDRESIAREKAGIMRKQKPVVYGDINMPKVIGSQAKKLSAPIYEFARDFKINSSRTGWNWVCSERTRSGLPLPVMRGQHQLKNAATALMALELLQPVLPVSEQDIISGILATTVPGRYQTIAILPQIILDVAHNPQASKLLADTLSQDKAAGRTLVVVGILLDKDIREILRPMVPVTDYWLLVDLTGENQSRGAGASLLESALRSIAADTRLDTFSSPIAAYEAAVKIAHPTDRIVVFGSFSTVGGILGRIQ